MPEECIVRFQYPPRSFVSVPEVCAVWEAPERKSIGLYLWCIEIGRHLWVNYVGKTSAKTGFEGRLWTELQDWRKGLYLQPVDLDALMLGRRVRLSDPPANYLAESLKLLEPRYRILMAPLSKAEDCLLLEGALVHQLKSHPVTSAFLGNRDKDRGYLRGRDLELTIESPSSIVGLNTDAHGAIDPTTID